MIVLLECDIAIFGALSCNCCEVSPLSCFYLWGMECEHLVCAAQDILFLLTVCMIDELSNCALVC